MEQVEQIEESTLFKEDEAEQLVKLQNLRFTLIDKLTEGYTKLPNDRSGTELLATLINGGDDQVFKKVNLRLKAKENETATNLTGLVAQVLLKYNENGPSAKEIERKVKLGEEFELKDAVPGELDVGISSFTLSDLENMKVAKK
jgi:hypothetical protein